MSVLPYPNCGSRGGKTVEILIDFLVSVMANVIGCVVCKWLDRHDKGR